MLSALENLSPLEAGAFGTSLLPDAAAIWEELDGFSTLPIFCLLSCDVILVCITGIGTVGPALGCSKLILLSVGDSCDSLL